MMPGDKPFKTKYITKQLGCSRLSFAPSEKMLEYLDIKPGAVSIMGLMNDKDNKIQLVIDSLLSKAKPSAVIRAFAPRALNSRQKI